MAGKNRNLDKCFEDSQESGILNLTRRNMKEFPISVDIYDLTDVVRVDLSHNKFAEIPAELSNSFMMECLNSSYNNIRYISDLSHISSLTQLDLSNNQIQTLPVHICSLPLKTLILNHNKLESIPSESGLLGKLQHLDLSCNELTSIPSTFGELVSLRILNLRRNQLFSLPDEISKLKYLMKLDISCNKISVIPPAYRLITSLVQLNVKDNPLTSPPAQICLKGKLHIFKFLSLAAQKQDKVLSIDKDTRKNSRLSPSISSISSNSLLEHDLKLSHHDQTRESEEGLIAFDNIIQNEIPSKEAKDSESGEKIDVYPVIEEKLPKKEEDRESEKRMKNDSEPLEEYRHESHLSSNQKIATLSRIQEIGPGFTGKSTLSLDRANIRTYGSKIKSYADKEMTVEKQEASDIAERKEQLLKMRTEALLTKQKLEKIKCGPQSDQAVFEGIGKRSSLGKNKTAKVLKEGHSTFTMRRIFDSAKEEFQQLEKLRMAIESRLRITLPDDLPAALADGVVLCHLVNHVRKSTISVIHVPSAGMPKLTMPKCLMNVDAFIEGCRKLGVEKAQLCSPADILEEKNPNKVCMTVHALLQNASLTNV